MPTIINNSNYTFAPAEQQEISNAAEHAGVDVVYTKRDKEENLFHFYSDEQFEYYLFSIDTDADGGCVIWEKA